MSKILWFNTKSHLTTIGNNQNLADLFYDICMLLTKENKDGYDASQVLDCRINNMFGFEMNRIIDNEELGKKLIELKNEIIKTINNTKNEGLKEGKNLLKLLNQGKITLDELL